MQRYSPKEISSDVSGEGVCQVLKCESQCYLSMVIADMSVNNILIIHLNV